MKKFLDNFELSWPATVGCLEVNLISCPQYSFSSSHSNASVTNTEISVVGLSIYDLRTCRLFLSMGFFWSHLAQREGVELFDGQYCPNRQTSPHRPDEDGFRGWDGIVITKRAGGLQWNWPYNLKFIRRYTPQQKICVIFILCFSSVVPFA